MRPQNNKKLNILLTYFYDQNKALKIIKKVLISSKIYLDYKKKTVRILKRLLRSSTIDDNNLKVFRMKLEDYE